MKKTNFSPARSQRLLDSAAGKLPWLATMTPAELLWMSEWEFDQ